ncbi:hypothetical protein EPA93_24725 [Ktedonosporobacter rubrisoli]|uniref:HNH endonuclease n=1 Tax=Ktedonosporobacter rubrisoli TaxID=2509675 RepID=A0A4P6JUJ8_KTERU|nr:hypothetical protein [Ktedonosporobacter rubrisoli]QBD79013.1 hypothetical protein EPA93_24725 [Ktedonosporobacter rubrisoli]
MKKVCPGCSQERDVEEDFRWKHKARGIRQRWCKFCQAEANRRHYQNNKQVYLNRAVVRNTYVNNENKQRLYAYLLAHPCIDCGNTDIRCLDFDHVSDNKACDISKMLNRALSWSIIEAEITKCEVRCANCHRLKTLERSQQWRFRQG